MKKTAALVLCLVFILLLIGCETKKEQSEKQSVENLQSVTEKSNGSIPGFSYAEDSAIYVDGEPGVKTSGFVNTAETDINSDNVTIIAKHECTVEYDNSEVYYDTVAGIWKVDFFSEETDGGCQTVYLDSNGKTVLVVYGE